MKPFIEKNNFIDYKSQFDNSRILKLLGHYTISRDIANSHLIKDNDYNKLKKQFDQLIKKDNLLNLTLTYDYS